MADPRRVVGSTPLIVDNIVRFCDLETKKSCRLVNKTWQKETLNHVWLRNVTWVEEDGPDSRFVALFDNPLSLFCNIHLYRRVQPQLLDYLDSNLKSLELTNVYFHTIAEMENVLFNNFENMKVLILDRVGVKQQEKRVQYPPGALRDLTPAKAQKLESLTIDMGDDYDWKSQEQPGVLVLGLDTLFQKFNKIKTLKFHMGNHGPESDVFGVLLEGKIAPQTLLFNSFMFVPDSMAEYLTAYGELLLHVEAVIDSDERDMERFKNVKVDSWLSVGMDRADWNTFGRGTFKNLQRLKIVGGMFESFDFLCRMPVLKEIAFVDRYLNDDYDVGKVTALDRNSPCKTVTKMDLNVFFTKNPELYFQVFPNATQVKLGCSGEQLVDIVNKWPMLNKLHLSWVESSEVAEVTKNVMRFEALDNFLYGCENLTFGDGEGEKFLSHSRLIYLRLRNISMSFQMVRLLKQKLIEFEYVCWNGIRQRHVNVNKWHYSF